MAGARHSWLRFFTETGLEQFRCQHCGIIKRHVIHLGKHQTEYHTRHGVTFHRAPECGDWRPPDAVAKPASKP